MKKFTLYNFTLLIAAICIIAAFVLVLNNPFFITFFISLAISFRGIESLKGFAYTITIFAAVSSALFYPGFFVEWNGYKLAMLITPLIQLIMFGMGTSMSI